MIFEGFKVKWSVVLFLICALGTATALASEAVSLASLNATGAASGNGGSAGGRLSAGGRFVVFSSDASNLVANDTNGRSDVFVRDLATGVTRLVSVNKAGTGGGNNDSFGAIISANGRYVVFTSYASNLVANDANALPDLFVRDLATKTTKLISVNRAGTSGGNIPTLGSVDPAITPDGRFVAFYSAASDLVANDTNNLIDLFLRDIVAGTTSLISVNRAGNAAGIGLLFTPAISADGRFVAFQSEANDLVENDPQRAGGNQDTDVFVRDVAAGTTSLVSLNRAATSSGNAPSRFPSMTYTCATGQPESRLL
jgi:Tol biopolymer transport system component